MDRDQTWIHDILRRGSREAADQLIRAYYDEIYRFVYRQTGNREDALDLTQESLIAALRSLPSYDAKKAGFRTWLYHVVTYRLIDARRRCRHETVSLQEEEQVSGEDVAVSIMNRELLQRIEDYVCALEPALQEIFRLRIYGEYSFPEIALAAAEPEAKIKAQYYRLIQRLRKEFDIDV